MLFTHEQTMNATDIKILTALQRDGRLSNQELADQIGLSASQCSRRRAALEQSGIIEGYRAKLSASALGLELVAFVEISLSRHSPELGVALGQLLDSLPEVQEAHALTGDADYLVKLIVPNLKSLSHILNDVLLGHESVLKVKSSVALTTLKDTDELPLT